MNSMVVFLIPLLGLVIWLSFFAKTDHQKTKPKSQWLNLKLRDIQIFNGYEFVQCLYDFGFKYDEQHQIFNYNTENQLWFRCLNLRKPGKFDNLEDGKAINGLMFVTDIAAVNPDDKEACLEEMVKLATLCQEQYGGQLCDASGPVEAEEWFNETVNMMRTQGVQQDLLST